MADATAAKNPDTGSYLKRLGARLLSEANDLKRTPEALAKDLDLDFSIIQSVLDGVADEETARAVLFRMADCYPVSVSDLWVDRDDTDGGVVVMKADQSESTSRVFERPGAGGEPAPYYEYRDTAMSRLAPFRPEWIRELRVVGDDDPANPGVVFNKGHLAHQQTFFIGPVNFYWEIDGQRFSAEMETGDSNYITPFVPHSFANRDENEMALIIAVTYSGRVHQSLQDFSCIGTEAADAAAGTGGNDGFASRLNRHLAAASLSPGQFAEMLTDAGLSAARVGSLVGGEAVPGTEELSIMVGLLTIRDEDLMVSATEPGDRVIVCRHGKATVRQFPAGNEPGYRLRELARSRQQPYLKGFEVTVLSSETAKSGGEGDFHHGLHEYVYNYGAEAVTMTWGPDGRKAVLEPGDSAYIQPFVVHGFEAAGGDGHLVMIRIPGNLTDALFDEYASFPASGRSRVAGEIEVWF